MYVIFFLTILVLTYLKKYISTNIIMFFGNIFVILLPIIILEKKINKKSLIDLLKNNKTINIYLAFLIFLLSISLQFGLTYPTYLFIKNMLNKPFNLSSPNFFILISSLIISPILEELLFRKIIFNNLLQYKSYYYSLIFSSLTFCLLHPNISNLIPVFILSLITGWIYFKTNNIFYSVIFHFGFNSSTFFINFLKNNGCYNDYFIYIFVFFFVFFGYKLYMNFKRFIYE